MLIVISKLLLMLKTKKLKLKKNLYSKDLYFLGMCLAKI